MPLEIKWECPTCGKSRMMNKDVTLILCSTRGCRMKQLIRVGDIDSEKEEEPHYPLVHAELIDDEYDPDEEDL